MEYSFANSLINCDGMAIPVDGIHNALLYCDGELLETSELVIVKPGQLI